MILVVGGAGYIGSHIVEKLCENNQDCLVIDNLVYGHKEALYNKQITFEHCDLLDKAKLNEIFNKYDIKAVMHFAAYAYVGESVIEPQKYYINNVVGSINLLEVMLKHNVKNIVFSSTCATYGEPKHIPIDENHEQRPINPYGKTKLMIEELLADYNKAYGLRYIALRYFNAAGASLSGKIGESHNPETHVIPRVFMAINGQIDAFSIFGNDYPTADGTCIRDYIHVSDLADAHILALDKLDNYCGYLNLGTGIGTSVKEIIDAAEAVTGKKCPFEIQPKRAGDPAILYADNKKAKAILGWEPKFTNIQDIIKTAWQWECNRTY